MLSVPQPNTLEPVKQASLLTASVLTVAGALTPARAGMLQKGVSSKGVYWGLGKIK